MSNGEVFKTCGNCQIKSVTGNDNCVCVNASAWIQLEYKHPVYTISTISNILNDANRDLWALKQLLHMARWGFRNKGSDDLIPKKEMVDYLSDKSRFKEWLDCNNYDVTSDDDNDVKQSKKFEVRGFRHRDERVSLLN